MKKENVTGYVLPSIFFVCGIIVSIYSNEIKQKLSNMDIQIFIVMTLFSLSVGSISYSFYLRSKNKVKLLYKLIELNKSEYDHFIKLITNRLDECNIPYCLKDSEIDLHEEILNKRESETKELQERLKIELN